MAEALSIAARRLGLGKTAGERAEWSNLAAARELLQRMKAPPGREDGPGSRSFGAVADRSQYAQLDRTITAREFELLTRTMARPA